MKKIKELDYVYDQCIAEGYILEPEEINFDKAESLFNNAKQDIETLKDTSPIMEKKQNYSLLWRSNYDILRQLIQGILVLEKIKSENHQCLFAYICIKHKDWEIDWETIETMRMLRNNIHYDGRLLNSEIWKEYKIKFYIYIQTFVRILEEKLNSINRSQ